MKKTVQRKKGKRTFRCEREGSCNIHAEFFLELLL